MPGRRDYGSLANKALTDQRFKAVATLLRKDPKLLAALAVVTARGIMPHLGLWALRETDDGVLPGDGVEAVRFALGIDEADAEKVVKALRHPLSRLMKGAKGGLYLAGFRDLYGPVVKARDKNRERVRKYREEQEKRQEQEARHVTRTGKKPSRARNAHVTGDVRVRSRVDRIGSNPIGSNPIESDPLTSKSTSTTPPNPPQAGGSPGGSASPSSDNGTSSLEGGDLKTTTAADAPSAAPVDPRQPLPPSLQELLDASKPDRPGGGGGNGSLPHEGNGRAAWFAEVEACCARAGHGGELTSIPMAAAFVDQMDMLRAGGATADEVAGAFVKRNPASMPSTVFQKVRRRLERGGR